MQSMQVAARAGWAMQQMQQLMQLQMQQMQQMQTGMLACKACAGAHRAHTCGRGTKRRALQPLVPNDCVAPRACSRFATRRRAGRIRPICAHLCPAPAVVSF